MPLTDEMERQGAWLFRWRSFLPLIMLPLVLVALKDADYLERIGGEKTEQLWQFFCIFVSVLGLIIRAATGGHVPKGTSGRNTKKQKAQTLNTTGMYSIVRHPLYLGNLLTTLGMAMFPGVWWLPIIASFSFWLYYERIMIAEEKYLYGEFGEQYLEWANKTPILLPKFQRWQKPDLPFSIKAVLVREYTTYFVMIVYFAFVRNVEEIIGDGAVDRTWLMIFVVGFMFYSIVRLLKKRTRFLYVEGR